MGRVGIILLTVLWLTPACGGVGVGGDCADGELSASETDIDCGGACDPCADGQGCAGGADCQSGVCFNQMCAGAECTDGLQNGDESDTDCGGACGATCDTDATCGGPADCISGVCSGTCNAPSCADNTTNGDETDVDCGGSCGGCAVGEACAVADDCESNNCTSDLVCGDAFRRVFVTSQLTTGVLGGLAGGDALCQNLATAANLTGTYLAWLSDSNNSPSTRFVRSTQPYVLVDGTRIAANFDDLISGSIDASINLTESGNAPPLTDDVCNNNANDFVHTGTGSNGAASNTCSNWSTVNAPGTWGRIGRIDSGWSGNCFGGIDLCGRNALLYCFEQ